MIKKNKWKLIFSSIAILLPALLGLIFRERFFGLPGGQEGLTKPLLIMPLVFFVFHWVCALVSAKDVKGAEQNQKVFSIVIWIIPVLTWFTCGIIYAAAQGMALEMSQLSCLVVGVFFTVLGNYLPKCKQSFTTGIKIKWTLSNEENWYATHRLAGKVWTVCGLLVMACTFLPMPWCFVVMFPLMLVSCVVPVVYSYRYYQKQVAEGRAPQKAEVVLSKNMKLTRNVALTLVAVLLIGMSVFIFGFAGYEIEYSETAIVIDATGWEDMTIRYEEIQSIEYRESCAVGVRTYGFGDVPVQLGLYSNTEFGSYIRFAYAANGPVVVLKVDDQIIAIGGKDAESTQAIYDAICQKMGKD